MVRTFTSRAGTALLLSLVAAPLIATTPVAAQSNQLAGRWGCNVATHNTRSGFREMSQYALLLYPNGTFRAQGTSRGGGAGSRFVAQGRWRVSQSNGAYWLSANGQKVSQWSTGSRLRGRHATFGKIFNTRYIGWRNLAPGGVRITLVCRR